MREFFERVFLGAIFVLSDREKSGRGREPRGIRRKNKGLKYDPLICIDSVYKNHETDKVIGSHKPPLFPFCSDINSTTLKGHDSCAP
jgi:hypothetical protein